MTPSHNAGLWRHGGCSDLDSMLGNVLPSFVIRFPIDIVLPKRNTKESTCLLSHIKTEKSDLCQYAVCITQNTTLEN